VGIEFTFGNIDSGVAPDADATPLDAGTPFHIAVLGDFSGRSNRSVLQTGAEIATRRPIEVDRDNFEEVLAALGVRLTNTLLSSDREPVSVEFRELDDFHPDELFGRLNLFESLRKLRRQLNKSATFEQAAQEVRSWGTLPKPATPESSQPAPPETDSPEINGGDLLDQVLSESQQSAEVRSSDVVDWQAMIRDIVEPYSLPGADPQLPQLVECVDAAIGRAMQTLLHHPAFQSLESAWRSLYLLVRRLETGVGLKLFLIDISKEELSADLSAADDLTSTGVYRLLVEQSVGTPGGTPWSVLVGNYSFEPDARDVETLGRMARIGKAAGVPFLAAAGGSVVGCPEPNRTPDPQDWTNLGEDSKRAWKALCDLPDATHVGLVWPRFLLRLPYRKKSSPTGQFEFEEMPDEFEHKSLLWGNGAFGCACVLAQAYSTSGSNMQSGELDELGGMPVYVYDSDGESVAHPCGELLLRESGAQRVVASGVIPLLSIVDQDVIRIGMLNSVRGEPLAGPWA